MLLRCIACKRLHIPIEKTPKHDVRYNVLIGRLRDKHLVDRLMTVNARADRPRFLDTAKRLLALNTNTLPDDSTPLSAVELQKSVNQKKEIKELKGLIADLRKEVQDIRYVYQETEIYPCYHWLFLQKKWSSTKKLPR